MPKKLTDLNVEGSLSFGAAEQQFDPECCQIAAKIIAVWSEVEFPLGRIYCFSPRGGSYHARLKRFRESSGTTKRIILVREALAGRSPHDILYEGISKKYLWPAGDIRNRLAHWCWVPHTGLPQSICLIRPDDLTDVTGARFLADEDPQLRTLESYVDVYDKDELLAVLADVAFAAKALSALIGWIIAPSPGSMKHSYNHLISIPGLKEYAASKGVMLELEVW